MPPAAPTTIPPMNVKRIGTHVRDTGVMKTPTKEQGKMPKGRFSRYLKFNGEPYCHTNEGLYMLLPEAEPSLGYKYQEVKTNHKTILDSAEEITEDAAIHLLFR